MRATIKRLPPLISFQYAREFPSAPFILALLTLLSGVVIAWRATKVTGR